MNTSRTCSLCGNNGHNSRTCAEVDAGGTGIGTGGGGGSDNSIMLFGVRVTEGSGGGSSSSSFRKSVSMNNLCQYEQQPQELINNNAADAGYASDGVVHPSGCCRERKRGTPWTEEEHRLFLFGLQKVGKGDWRGISRNFVKTRTPTQVASHAQKYFLRRNNCNRRRRRSSLFDITTDTRIPHEAMPPPLLPRQAQYDFKPKDFPAMLPLPPRNSKVGHLNIEERKRPEPEDPSPLSLKLSMPHTDEQAPADSQTTSSSFQPISGGSDSIDIVMSVA